MTTEECEPIPCLDPFEMLVRILTQETVDGKAHRGRQYLLPEEAEIIKKWVDNCTLPGNVLRAWRSVRV